MLTFANLLSMLPLNMHTFDTLPEIVQKEIKGQAKIRLSEYKKRLATRQRSLPEQDLMLHLQPQICYQGEKSPEGQTPWPQEMTQYFCASNELANWCFKYNNLYQTTENVFPLPKGYRLHTSLSCYRVRRWNQALDDCHKWLCMATFFLVSIVLHSWYVKSQEPQQDRRPSLPPPPPPTRKHPKSGPAPPLRNLRSRHENYKSRR
ncbi:unnamed protein product [Caenorhabditis nigoni]